MMMVLVIAVVAAGVAIPTTANTIADIKLRGSAASFAGLAQQARLAAVQKNASYVVCFGLPSGRGTYAEKLDPLNPCDGYASGDLVVQFGGEADYASAPTGTNPSKLDGTGSTLGWTGTSGNVSFNSRGLPCSSSSTACSTNVNYVFYFNDTRAFGSQGWSAVSITAAGRTKVWFWSGSKWID
jgi:type II secretory pathway pseudopilin PulG